MSCTLESNCDCNCCCIECTDYLECFESCSQADAIEFYEECSYYEKGEKL